MLSQLDQKAKSLVFVLLSFLSLPRNSDPGTICRAAGPTPALAFSVPKWGVPKVMSTGTVSWPPSFSR